MKCTFDGIFPSHTSCGNFQQLTPVPSTISSDGGGAVKLIRRNESFEHYRQLRHKGVALMQNFGVELSILRSQRNHWNFICQQGVEFISELCLPLTRIWLELWNVIYNWNRNLCFCVGERFSESQNIKSTRGTEINRISLLCFEFAASNYSAKWIWSQFEKFSGFVKYN